MNDPGDRPQPKYWFPAKRYGWGWGPPATWQGWVVLVVELVVLVIGAEKLATRPVALVTFVAINVAALTAICYAKGERPRWRWGDRDR